MSLPLEPDEASEFDLDLDEWLKKERERRRAWRAYLRGDRKPQVSAEERAKMRAEFYAKGGQVTRCPEGEAEDAWGGGVLPQPVRVELEEPEDAE